MRELELPKLALACLVVLPVHGQHVRLFRRGKPFPTADCRQKPAHVLENDAHLRRRWAEVSDALLDDLLLDCVPEPAEQPPQLVPRQRPPAARVELRKQGAELCVLVLQAPSHDHEELAPTQIRVGVVIEPPDDFLRRHDRRGCAEPAQRAGQLGRRHFPRIVGVVPIEYRHQFTRLAQSEAVALVEDAQGLLELDQLDLPGAVRIHLPEDLLNRSVRHSKAQVPEQMPELPDSHRAVLVAVQVSEHVPQLLLPPCRHHVDHHAELGEMQVRYPTVESGSEQGLDGRADGRRLDVEVAQCFEGPGDPGFGHLPTVGGVLQRLKSPPDVRIVHQLLHLEVGSRVPRRSRHHRLLVLLLLASGDRAADVCKFALLGLGLARRNRVRSNLAGFEAVTRREVGLFLSCQAVGRRQNGPFLLQPLFVGPLACDLAEQVRVATLRHLQLLGHLPYAFPPGLHQRVLVGDDLALVLRELIEQVAVVHPQVEQRRGRFRVEAHARGHDLRHADWQVLAAHVGKVEGSRAQAWTNQAAVAEVALHAAARTAAPTAAPTPAPTAASPRG
mmetsp:Transcript_95755/g.292826  ORF Transcript_95755/g.292826 Transcript_95755/m.292826 type:complete len:559 (+) Transcript_95755:951-2627(+)